MNPEPRGYSRAQRAVLDMPVEMIAFYEAARSPWMSLVSWPWLQTLCSRYLAWKVKRIKARFDRRARLYRS